MKLTDIAPIERWEELERDLNARFGVDANVFDPGGFRISAVKNWVNEICPAIKATDKGQSFICAPAHMNIAAQAMREGTTVIEECDAGLIKLVVPIMVAGEFSGAVGACGVMHAGGEVDAFLVNKMADIAEDTVERLAATVRPVTRETVEELGRFISSKVAEIVAGAAPQSGSKS
jgi:ligand-binding sensor protein